ncbi:MAG: porin [Haliscomenobacteraceae bacterium CHB4]|nr:porin [Haliscomenobacteraceae bacterium CHB4]
MNKILFPLIFFAPLFVGAQIDTSTLSFTFSGYAEPYYGYDFGQPESGNRPGFVYSHNRHNEFSLNITYLKGSVNAQRFRGNLALMAGTYANANLAAEHGSLQNLYEANAGVKLFKKSELWIDGGIFSSHIGFESAVGKDCWTLTRSILADNSPYYESGAKLSYTTPDGKWFLSALALNGWQRIQRPTGNSTVAGGWQIQFKPSGKVTLNSSSFFGSDKPDSLSLGRIFHNFYGIFQVSDKFGLTLGLDTGWEENPREGEGQNFWYSPVVIARYAFNDRVALAVRSEYYSDENGVIITTGTENGFKTMGFSANLDVQVHRNTLWRIEGKLFSSEDDVFLDADGDATNTNAVVTTSLAVWF